MLARALRHAGIAALVAFGLFGLMLGLKTEAGDTGLQLLARPWQVVIAVGMVFLGTFASRLGLFAPLNALGRVKVPGLAGAGRYLGPAILVLAVILPFIPGVGRYEVDLATLILTYVMLGWGLNIVVGLAGLLDLGYVAFYAVGAYSFAILSTTFGLGFWVCLPVAGLLAALWGIMLGFPVLRLRGDYLAIVTLAFGEIIRVVLINFVSLTNGPNGISGIPRPTFFGLTFTAGGGEDSFADFFGVEPSVFQRIAFLYYIILALALLTNAVTNRLRRLPYGRAWEAMREDEIACRSLGINTTVTKLTAFAIGAGFGGLAGAFFATRQAFVSPESFTFIESAIVLAIVVLGGMGSQLGIVLAATVMVGGFELFRDLQEYRMLLFGVVLVIVMVARPGGFISRREPTIRLVADPAASRLQRWRQR